MNWKVFKITYNDGGWHSGDLPHFYYIAENEEEVISNSKKYKRFLEYKEQRGGSVWISEFNGIRSSYEWENLENFEVSLSIKKK